MKKVADIRQKKRADWLSWDKENARPPELWFWMVERGLIRLTGIVNMLIKDRIVTELVTVSRTWSTVNLSCARPTSGNANVRTAKCYVKLKELVFAPCDRDRGMSSVHSHIWARVTSTSQHYGLFQARNPPNAGLETSVGDPFINLGAPKRISTFKQVLGIFACKSIAALVESLHRTWDMERFRLVPQTL